MLGAYLISVAIKSTVLLAVSFILLRLLRTQGSVVRHTVCFAALLSAASVPLLALWPVRWSLAIVIPAGAGAAGTAAGTKAGAVDWPMTIALFWALGVLVMTVRAAGGWIVLWQVRRASLPFLNSGGIEVRIADVNTPLACGVLSPLILLPASARNWDREQLSAVLLHESAHVHRHDCAAKYVAQGSRALLWWNPLAWIFTARMNREQELACDAAVLDAGVAADDYAAILMDLVRGCPGPLVFGCAMAGAAALGDRLTQLFLERGEPRPQARRMAIAIPALLLLLTTLSFAQKVYNIGPGIVPPKVLQKHDPSYTKEARAAKIQGPVQLSIIVGTDHRGHDIQITKSLDPGLDASAIKSIMTWRFRPAMKDGKPVAVRAKVVVNFRLH